MADTKLRLEVIMAAVDRLTGPLKAIHGGSQRMVEGMKAARQAVKDLEDQQSKLDKFTKARESAHMARADYFAKQKALEDKSSKYHDAKDTQQMLRERVLAERRKVNELFFRMSKKDQTPGLPNFLYEQRKALEKTEIAYSKAQNQVRRYRAEIAEESRSVHAAKEAKQRWFEILKHTSGILKENGVDLRKLTVYQEQLKAKTEEATAAAEKQGKAMERLHAARAQYDKTMATRDKALAAGVTAGATGGAIVWGLDKTVHQASEYQKEVLKIKALGMGDHVTQDADKFARGMKVYGTSMLENVDMMRDGLTIFADLHHAEMALPVMQKMKFANAALYGDAAGTEKSQQLYDMLKVVELRGGAKDANTFKAEAELIQKVMSSTGGRVGSKDYKELIQTGGVSAKQLSTDVFYNVLEPMIQEMGGHQVGTGLQSAFQNLYLGKSTTAAARTLGDLGLLREGMVEYDKIGQIKRMKTGAIVGGDTYKANPFEWLETHFLPALAKKGITDPSQVRDMLATVVGNRTGAKVLSTYLDQRDQINRSADRNRKAFGIDQTYDTAKESADGKKIALHKRFEDVQMLMGERLLPVYTKLLDLLTWVTDAVGNFAEKHPTLVTAMGYTAAAVGGLLLVFGGLAIAVAAVLGPFAMAKLAMSTLGIAGIALPGVMSVMGTALGYVGTALRAVGTAVLWVGRLFLANPILAAVAAIAAAAAYVWSHWDTLGPKFWALWDGIKTGAADAWGWVTDKARAAGQIMVELFMNWTLPGLIIKHWDSITTFIGALPAKFATMGGQIIDGLITGLSARWEAAKAWFSDMGGKIAQTVRDALGIKSPSRVFAEIGGHIMGGLTMGLDGGENGPLARIKAITDKLTAAGAGIAIGMGASGAMAAPVAIDTRPPLTASAAASGTGAGLSIVNQITINAAPGMDEAALARLVAAEIDKATRRTQMTGRSRLTDRD